MLLLRTDSLTSGEQWLYELKLDGEVVAFDQEGRPSFNALQNHGSAPRPVVYYVFDVMVLRGEKLLIPLERRDVRVVEGARLKAKLARNTEGRSETSTRTASTN